MKDKPPGRIVLTAAGYKLIAVILFFAVGLGFGLYNGFIRIGS